MPSTSACRLTRVEMVTRRAMPAACARATTASSSSAKSGKSRWQWLSISIGSVPYLRSQRNAERPGLALAAPCRRRSGAPRRARRTAVGRVGAGARSRRRQRTATLARDHGQRALRQVTEIIGKIGIGTVHDSLEAVIAVLAERNFTQEEITDLVDAKGIHQRKRIDHVADG